MNKKRFGWLAIVASVTLAFAPVTEAGELFRLSSEWSPVNSEFFTSSTTPKTFYTKTITVPSIGTNTAQTYLFVTLTAVGDVHGGNAMALNCIVDGVACHSQGYLRVQKLPTDEHDNNVVASWCAPASPGTHSVTLQFSSDGADTFSDVYMENVIVHLDASRISQGPCNQGAGYIF